MLRIKALTDTVQAQSTKLAHPRAQSAHQMGILEQRSRVLWIKDLARLEALVRDAGGE
jgi:hypothetical protein